MTTAEFLLARKLGKGSGGDITIEQLNVTANGTYQEEGKAYSPVVVNVPTPENSYQLKSIENTPTAIATFNASALPMPSLTVGIEAQQSGTGDPSPTNVRPISGWSAVNVYDVGKNLYDNTQPLLSGYLKEDGTTGGVSSDSNKHTYNISVKGGVTYTYSATIPRTLDCTCLWYDASGGIVDSFVLLRNTTSITATAPNNAVSASLTIYNTEGQNVQFEVGETATTYEAYNGTTYTTTLKDGQGNPMTCYGGELSNVNGVQSLANEWLYLTIDNVDELMLAETSSRRYFSKTVGVYNSIVNGSIICDSYITTIVNTSTTTVGINIINSSAYSDARINIRPSNVGNYTLESFNAELAENPIHVIYKLATPQTISQDNLAISSSAGINNIWADTGDIQSGEYMEAL